MQHSIVRFIHKDLKKNGKGKEANDKYRKLYQNRIKRRKKQWKHWEATVFTKTWNRMLFFCFVCFIWVMSFVVPLKLSNYYLVLDIFFFKLLDRHKLRHCAKFYQDGMVAFSVLDKAGRRGVLPNISYQQLIPFGSWLIFTSSTGNTCMLCMLKWNVL